MDVHVQLLQEHKQHHVHIWDEEAGERIPLTHCRRKDNPKLCKSDFPRTLWLVDEAVILCQGLLKSMGMPFTGKRNKLGSLHGPMNQENLNGTDGAMLAAHGFNSDVQLPYRFAISTETHTYCSVNCIDLASSDEIIEACQLCQDAQAWYACDYCNKRQPMAFNEVKECMKGHHTLNEQLEGQPIRKIGKRHHLRLMSDCYGEGIVRGQQENTNLRANAKDNDAAHAEAFRAALCEAFFGREYLNVIERLNDKRSPDGYVQFFGVDARNRKRRKVTIRDVAMLYGQRPKHESVWYPLSIADKDDPKYHASLTGCGVQKLRESAHDELPAALIPGIDYKVREGDGETWLPFPDVGSTAHFCHTWVLVRRRRPKVPSFFGAPVPRHRPGEQSRPAMIVMSYFHPWTLRKDDADQSVPHASSLRSTTQTWQEALMTWLDGNIVCEEAKKYVGNFLAVHRVRPRDEDDDEDANSDDIGSDVELEVSHEHLQDALITRIGGRESN